MIRLCKSPFRCSRHSWRTCRRSVCTPRAYSPSSLAEFFLAGTPRSLFQRALSPTSVRGLGNCRISAEWFCFHDHRFAIAANPRLAQRRIACVAHRERASGQRRRRASADRVGVCGCISTFLAGQENPRTRSFSRLAKRDDHRVVGNARRHLAGRGLCSTICVTRREAVPRKELHSISHLWCDSRDPGLSRSHAAACHPETSDQRR